MAPTFARLTAATSPPAAGKRPSGTNNHPVAQCHEEKRSEKVSRSQNGAIGGAIGGYHFWSHLRNVVLSSLKKVGNGRNYVRFVLFVVRNVQNLRRYRAIARNQCAWIFCLLVAKLLNVLPCFLLHNNTAMCLFFCAFLVQADRMGGQQCPTGTQYPPATRNFYQTQVYLGSDLWVLMSLRE